MLVYVNKKHSFLNSEFLQQDYIAKKIYSESRINGWNAIISCYNIMKYDCN